MMKSTAHVPHLRSLPRRPVRVRHALALPLVALGLACSSATAPDAPTPESSAALGRVGACEGPATSLPSRLASGLAPTGGVRTPDDRWAELARRVPGGFAGVMYELPAPGAPTRTTGRPLLMLVDPARAAEAKAALAPHLQGFDVAGADVRAVRWDFAQLYDWYRYLNGQIWQEPGVTMSDIDESENRIAYGAADEAARDRVAQRLAALPLPCDLVLVRIVPPARTLAR